MIDEESVIQRYLLATDVVLVGGLIAKNEIRMTPRRRR